MLDDGSAGAEVADREQHVAVAGTEEREGGGEAFWVWAAQWEGELALGGQMAVKSLRKSRTVMADLFDDVETVR